MRVPRRGSRRLSLVRQLLIGAPLVLLTFGVALLLLVLVSLDVALLFLVPAGPLSLVIAGLGARRVDRWIDGRGPAITLEGRVLTVPLEGADLVLDLSRPASAKVGWWSNRLKNPGEPGLQDRSEGVHMAVRQGEQAVLIHADDGLAKAPQHGIPRRLPEDIPELRVRVWARDLVALIAGIQEG